MKERLHSTQNELHESKTTLIATQDKLQTTQTTVDATQKELHATKTFLRTTQNELQTTQTTVDATQKELHATKTSLLTTQHKLQTTQTIVDATQKELHATKTSLLTTQDKLQTTQKILDKTQNDLQTKWLAKVFTDTPGSFPLKITTIIFIFIIITTTLVTTKNELKATQLKLEQTMVELNHAKKDATKCQSQIKLHEKTQLKLEQTMVELNHAKKDATKCQSQIKFLQENIQKQIENGLKLNHQITERFASYLSTMKQKLSDKEIDIFSKSLKIPLPNRIKPMEPFKINGMKLEFSKVNELVQNVNNPHKSHKKKYEILLKKMENIQIYHIDDKQFIFKLNLPKNQPRFLINHHNNIASLAKKHPNNVVLKNDQLVLWDNRNNRNEYQIFLQVPKYNNRNSHCYLYGKNEKGDKLLLKNGGWNNNISMDDYKTKSNEVLFHITKI